MTTGPTASYLLRLDIYPYRLALRAFTSRPVPTAELIGRLTLDDAIGTRFVMRVIEEESLDGKGVIEFEPAPPNGLVGLALRDAAGRALFTYSSVA